MPRNLVICFDGTNNEFGLENTNVVRLVQVLDRHQTKQLVHYDPGIGTLPEPGLFTRLGKRISEWVDLAFATSLSRRVEGGYQYLMNYWEPGDQVYLFGFSRGAYTARVLAAMLHNIGLLPRGGENLLPYAMRMFAASRRGDPNYWKLLGSFRQTFARAITPGDDKRRFPIHFLGVWDTVSSVGWVWNPATYPNTAENPSVAIARHAVSLDERRCFFRQNLLEAAEGQDIKEYWFPGVHSDIGGGYADSRLWQASFEWMVTEAKDAGLLLDRARYEALTKEPTPAWIEEQHESLKGPWWLAEFFPKMEWDYERKRRVPKFGFGRHRFVHEGATIDGAVLERLRRKANYQPPNLSGEFCGNIRQLPSVRGSEPYTP